jgi:hypothetical protein
MTLKITNDLFDDLSSDMERDLEAMFNLMKDDVLLLQEKAIEEGWTPEMFLNAVDILLQ